MFQSGKDHMRPGDFGLMLLLVQGPVQIQVHFRNGIGVFGKALDLDVAPTPAIADKSGAKHDQERRISHPSLAMGNLRDLGNQAGIGDNAKTPGLFISARRGKAASLQNLIHNRLEDGILLKFAHTEAGFEQFDDLSHASIIQDEKQKLPRQGES